MKIKRTQKPSRVLLELDRRDEHLLEGPCLTDRAREAFRLKKILVPIDFSECSKKALDYALRFAGQFGANLTLIHVIPANFAYGEYGGIDYGVLEGQLMQSARSQLAALAETTVPPEISAGTLVTAGRAAAEIVSAARKLDVDLIIIATHGRTGWKNFVLGSTAENVVRHAPCPVLAVRENEHEFI